MLQDYNKQKLNVEKVILLSSLIVVYNFTFVMIFSEHADHTPQNMPAFCEACCKAHGAHMSTYKYLQA